MDERLKAVRDEYGLDASDMWQLPQNKQWLIKHAALEVVAAKAGIVFDMPEIIERDSAAGIAVICVTGKWKDRIEWSFGEASPKNSKTGYPWAICEKRAKDRVILKLIGVHGLLYSEDEMPDTERATSAPAPVPADEDVPVMPAQTARLHFTTISKDLFGCDTLAKLQNAWGRHYRVFQTLPESFQNDLVIFKDELKGKLMDGASPPPAATAPVAPNFDNMEPAR